MPWVRAVLLCPVTESITGSQASKIVTQTPEVMRLSLKSCFFRNESGSAPQSIRLRSLDAAKGKVKECCVAAFRNDHFHLFALNWLKFEVFYQIGEYAGWCSSLRKTEMFQTGLRTHFFGEILVYMWGNFEMARNLKSSQGTVWDTTR